MVNNKFHNVRLDTHTCTKPDVFIRFNIVILEINDVDQKVSPEIDMMFYFDPAIMGISYNACGEGNIRFQRIDTPPWTLEIDFEREVAKAVKSEEFYWYDTKTKMVFGRQNFHPVMQDRWDHARFPFDRQVIEILARADNCTLKAWDTSCLGVRDCPWDLYKRMRDPSWRVQVQLFGEASHWHIQAIDTELDNAENEQMAYIMCRIFVERESNYYIWNLGFTYSLLMGAVGAVYEFPYCTSHRFIYTMTLALTSVTFKFVLTNQVPNCAYMTLIDIYILLGLIVLAARMFTDFMSEFFIDEIWCDDRSNPDNPFLQIDNVATVTIEIVWITISVLFLGFGARLFRQSWTAVLGGPTCTTLQEERRAEVLALIQIGSTYEETHSKNRAFEYMGTQKLFSNHFSTLDRDRDGYVDEDDLRHEMTERAEEIIYAEALKIIENQDSDGDGKLSLAEFQAACTELSSEEAKKIFAMIDVGNTGHIEEDELRQALRQHLNLSDEAIAAESKAIVEELDICGDGKISVEEFSKATSEQLERINLSASSDSPRSLQHETPSNSAKRKTIARLRLSSDLDLT